MELIINASFVFRDVERDQQRKELELRRIWTMAKVKGIVRKAYNINRLFTIELLLNGKLIEPEKYVKDVLPENGAEVQVLAIKEDQDYKQVLENVAKSMQTTSATYKDLYARIRRVTGRQFPEIKKVIDNAIERGETGILDEFRTLGDELEQLENEKIKYKRILSQGY